MKNVAKPAHIQLNAIKQALANFENGASLEEIILATGLNIELRTFQRRMAILKEKGEIIVSGDTRSTRYHLVKEKAQTGVSEPAEPYGKMEHVLPLSDASRQIIAAISLPMAMRTPVGYNREFLEKYRPNIDSYLSKGEKQRLEKLGFTGSVNQPAGTYAREIMKRLLIDLSWNSSRLEGNTYSLLDTERLLNLGEVSDTKTAIEAQMILNHKDAIEFLVEGADEIGFNRYSILNLHGLLSNNLLPEKAASGRLRRMVVGIHNSVYIPLGVPQQIEEMFDLFLEKASLIENPFEQAFFAMVHLPYLQPFDDVNKRVSRLAVNIPLNRKNLAPLSFIDVPNDFYIQGILGVYELNRMELLKDVFIWAYERSCMRYAAVRQSLGEPDPFMLTYRNQIRSLITKIITENLTHAQASAHLASEAGKLLETERAKFTEAVETELMSLHEGNFARYMVRPSVFKAWKEAWGR
jgi:Fic family protein